MTDIENSLAEIKPLAAGHILAAPIESFTCNEAMQAWALLDFLEGEIEKRKGDLRLRLLREAEEGEPDEKGNFQLPVAAGAVIRERRQAKMPDVEALMGLLRARSIPVLEAFDEVKVMQPNPSKINRLVQVGKLTQGEVDALHKTTWALQVKPGADLKVVLEQVARRYKEAKAVMVGSK